MNRAERRRLEKSKQKKEPIINIKAKDVQQIKEDAKQQAIDRAFFLMLAIPTMVIHDNYPKLMKKFEDGKSREERFADMCLELYDCFEKGLVSLDDLKECLWEEANIKLEKI